MENNCECNMETLFAESFMVNTWKSNTWKPHISFQFQGIPVKLMGKIFAVMSLI